LLYFAEKKFKQRAVKQSFIFLNSTNFYFYFQTKALRNGEEIHHPGARDVTAREIVKNYSHGRENRNDIMRISRARTHMASTHHQTAQITRVRRMLICQFLTSQKAKSKAISPHQER
jgi:hypothetical protein